MPLLKGKVAIVTGASRGIGKAIAERLAREGAAVVVNYVKNSARADEVVAAIESAGGTAVAIQADLASTGEMRRLFQQTAERFARLDILVNNAGMGVFKPVAAVTEQDYDSMFALNTRGPFFAMQEAARTMRNGGRIINISTAAVLRATPNSAIYGGSKAALETFSRVMAKELGERQITVNVVSPGPTDTDMLASNMPLKEMGAKLSPLGRLGEPDDIASVVVFLASDQGRWITGQVIQAGGGTA